MDFTDRVGDGSVPVPLDRRKDLFVLALAHDLRASLAAMAGALAVLREDGDDGDSVQATGLLGVMADAVDHAERVIASLVDVERFEHGATPITRVPTDLAQLLDRVVASSADAGRVEVAADGGEALVDPAITERIVANLVANALEHGGPGGRVTVHGSLGEGDVLIQVDDTGPGIPSAVRPTVFEPFHASSGGGIGVGLYLVRQFAVLHGGDAWFEDRPGGGTSVKVRLAAP